jgi:hypothetical protein
MKDTFMFYTTYAVKLSSFLLFCNTCTLCNFLYLASFTSHKLLASASLALYKDSSCGGYIKGRVVCDLEEGETVNDKLQE